MPSVHPPGLPSRPTPARWQPRVLPDMRQTARKSSQLLRPIVRWLGWRATCYLVESREDGVTSSVRLLSNLSRKMKLIVEPDEGIAPILTAIKQAKKTIDVLIF